MSAAKSRAPALTGAAGKEVMDLPIPGCFKGLFHSVIGQYLYATDDFVQTIRKVFIIVFLFGMLGNWVAAAWHVSSFTTHGAVPDLVMVIAQVISGFFFVSPYVVLRMTQKVSEGMVLAMSCGLAFIWTSCHLCSTAYDTRFGDAMIILSCMMIRTPYLGFFWVYFLLLNIQALLVDNWKHEPQTADSFPLLLIPGTRIASAEVSTLLCGITWVPCCLVLVAAWFGFQELQRQVRLAKRGVELAEQVVAELRMYNTDRVQELVEDARAKDEGNPELINSFQALVQNLVKYRPFLPNYLFQDDERGNPLSHDEEDGNREGGEDSVSVHSSEISYTDIEEITSPPESAPETIHARASPRSLHDVSALRHPTPSMRRGSMTLRSGGEQYCFYSNRLSFALVDIEIHRLMRICSSGPSRAVGTTRSAAPIAAQNAALTGIVNLIYQLAKETKAAVHSMLGDQVQLTWGATGAVAQPEVKGSLFLTRLRLLAAVRLQAIHQKQQHISDAKEAQQQPPGAPAVLPGLAGAICSGEAMVHSIITDTMQQALVVHAPWLPALEGCFDLGKRHGAMLADEATAMSASLSVGSVAVESLSYIESHSSTPIAACSVEQITVRPLSKPTYTFHEPRTSQSQVTCGLTAPSGSAKSCLVFQLTEEKKREADVEWMYQLDRAETTDDCKKSPEEVQKLVIQSFSQGKTEEARSLLEPETEGPFPTTDGDESSTSVGTASAGSTRAMSSAPSGCLPSLHQVIVASLHCSEEQHSSPVVKF